MECKKCLESNCVRNGKQKSGVQKWFCKKCQVCFQGSYTYQSYLVKNQELIILCKEGLGIRSISRVLHISSNTVLRRIKSISKNIIRPYPILKGKIYEVDEIFTYLKCKENRICIAYSFEAKTKHIIDFVVGRRNKRNLRKVTETLVLSEAEKIYTDKLNIYQELIPQEIHSTKNKGINHIERNNLSMRTHLKRLNRKTLCYSKSLVILTAILKIYFWA